MKHPPLIAGAVALLMSSIAFAGLVQPAPVVVDLVNRTALGDMVTARFADNDVEFIGCGVRVFDDGVGGAFAFGFCQAADSAGVNGFCSTTNAGLVASMTATADYSFITFSWNADGECTRVGLSTQSFYLPQGVGPDSDSDSDSD